MNDAFWKMVREVRANISKGVNAHESGDDISAIMRLNIAIAMLGTLSEKLTDSDNR